MRTCQGNIGHTYEDEDGLSPLKVPSVLDFDIDYRVTPGEPMVRYYPDGSGYPGSPPEVEIVGCRCVKIDERVPTKDEIKLLSDWFMDIATFGTTTWERIETAIFEQEDASEPADYDEPDYDDEWV